MPGTPLFPHTDPLPQSDSVIGTPLAGLRAVLGGQRAAFRLEYACPSPMRLQWFQMQVHELRHAPGGGAIVRLSQRQAELQAEREVLEAEWLVLLEAQETA